MTVCEAGSGNLSPSAQLRVRSSAVSGMGGMSSVTYARERAELVRAWWVTASGSGVAICGDTGKKLDRPVPAGFETGPARDPGKSPRAGCLGHHHQSFKFGHDVRRASRTPLISPGRKPVEGFVLFPPHFMGRWIAARRRDGGAPRQRRCVSDTLHCLPALTRRPLRPLLRQGYGGPTSPHCGEERERGAFPGFIPGPG